VGAVAVGSSNHFGAASYYTVEMARSGMVGLAFSNSDALVAPHNGVRPCFGTNPISVAAGGDDGEVFCADFATSQVSYSRVRHQRRQGRPLEPGWAVRADGSDAAEPPAARGREGGDTVQVPAPAPPAGGEIAALKPVGGGSGHKGQCLGMAVEILCCLLTGMPFDDELSHLYDPPFDRPRQVSHLFVALDVGAFIGASGFRERLSRRLAQVRAEPAAGAEPVVAPGDPERLCAERRRDEIPLGADELRALAALELEADGGARPPAPG
jgi:ureidoglycolate dehydrogenase (NAD+)